MIKNLFYHLLGFVVNLFYFCGMENIVGYTVHFLKRVGEPEMNRQQLEITSKIIPFELKDSFEEFIKSIGNKVPLEDEFNQWYSKQK